MRMADFWVCATLPLPANVFAVATTLGCGDMTSPEGEQLLLNALRQEFAPKVRLAWLQQVHGDQIVVGEKALEAKHRPAADGSYTCQPELGCVVKTADCLPVLLCDRQGTMVMALHAGWKGVLAAIIPKGVKQFVEKGIPASEIMMWFGPGICQDHYEVDQDFRQRFLNVNADYQAAFVSGHGPDKWHADLVLLATMQARGAGVEQVYSSGICTYHDARGFPSHRRTQALARMATVIGLKKVHSP